MGKEKITFFQEAKNVSKTLSWPFILPSTSPDPLQRQIEDDMAVEDFMQGQFGLRQMKDGSVAPYTYKFGIGAGHVYLGLPEARPSTRSGICSYSATHAVTGCSTTRGADLRRGIPRRGAAWPAAIRD